MKFIINRESLLKPLQLIAGVVEKRQTLPILANVLLTLKGNTLRLVGTDIEIELAAEITVENRGSDGETTAPARKLIDIGRSFPDGTILEFSLTENRLSVKSGRTRFNLATLPASDFPNAEEHPGILEFTLLKKDLRGLIETTDFAMAQQDVRYYLNGMLWEISGSMLRTVATDGHRLALSSLLSQTEGDTQIIVPRKAIFELTRLLSEGDGETAISVSPSQLRVKIEGFTFTSKLIDGRFPDYDRVIPQGGDKILIVERDLIKQALSRVAVLANDKQKNVRFELRANCLKLSATNQEQEEAEEQIEVDYPHEDLDIAFNIRYLMDVLTGLPMGPLKMIFSTSDASVRIENLEKDNSIYVVMPMRL